MDEYDCRDEAMLYGIPAKEILTLAAQTALALRAQYDLKTARTLMLISPYEDLFAGERQIHQGEGRFKLDSRGQVLSRTDRAF